MKIAIGTSTSVRDCADTSAAVSFSKPVLADKAVSAPERVVCRRADGSIDYTHYDRVARDMRAHDLRAALGILIAPGNWLLGALEPRTLARRWSSG